MIICNGFHAISEANKTTFGWGLAATGLSWVGASIGFTLLAVPMDIRRPLTGITPGMTTFDPFLKFSSDKTRNSDELPMELLWEDLQKYFPNSRDREVGKPG
jgi:hypothetical protein